MNTLRYLWTVLSLLVITPVSIRPINALGINCRGSSLCPQQELHSPDYIQTILRISLGTAYDCSPRWGFNCGPMNDTDVYAPGAKIICLPQGRSFLGGICVFTQGNVAPLGMYGVAIKKKLKELRQHGCEICGSVPIGNDNDPDEAGILTVNYVSGAVCWGLCPPTHYNRVLSGSDMNVSLSRMTSQDSFETA